VVLPTTVYGDVRPLWGCLGVFCATVESEPSIPTHATIRPGYPRGSPGPARGHYFR